MPPPADLRQPSPRRGAIRATWHACSTASRGSPPRLPLAAVWFIGSTVLYFILKVLPNRLSGTLMGTAVGFETCYLAQLYIQWHWAIGIGLGTAALMYFLYSSLR